MSGLGPSRLAVQVEDAEGNSYRWGPDEWEAKNIPQSITFDTSMPGGFKSATITLPRRIDLDYPDLNLFDTVRILGPGDEVAWEGRVQQLPRSHGDTFSIQVGAVGWSAHLTDDPSFKEVYVGRDLTEWTEMSSGWRLWWSEVANLASQGFSVAPDSNEGLPSIALEVDGHWESRIPVSGCLYDAGASLGLALLDYEVVGLNGDPNWVLEVGQADADTPTAGGVFIVDLATGITAGNGTVSLQNKRVTNFEFRFSSAPGGADGAQWKAYLRNLAWFGNHGLPIRGTFPGRGLYASDIIADVLSRAAPLLTFSPGEGGSIQPSGFPIPHLVFRSGVTANDVIMAVNAYHLWDWGVYEDREFFFKEPNPETLTWEARLSEGAQLELEGSQAEDAFNGVWVNYSDPAGVAHSVGPPGSDADATDPSLVDTSMTNPINAHGIPKRWAVLEISQPTTQAGAIQLGAIYLGEKALPQRRGTLTLTGPVEHPTAGRLPAWNLRAGHWIRISDHPTDVPRKIIATSYNATSGAISLTLDNTSHKVDAILERLGAALLGVVH